MNYNHRVLYCARKVMRTVTIAGQASGVLDHYDTLPCLRRFASDFQWPTQRCCSKSLESQNATSNNWNKGTPTPHSADTTYAPGRPLTWAFIPTCYRPRKSVKARASSSASAVGRGSRSSFRFFPGNFCLFFGEWLSCSGVGPRSDSRET